MKQEILIQIQKLGGDISNVKGNSLQEDLESIKFKNPLYPNNYHDELYGIDDFYKINKQLYLDNKPAFYEALIDYFFADHEMNHGQAFFRNFLFTPFKQDSEDFEELDGLVEEVEIREVVNGTDLDFMCICYSYGFPDQYFICLTDPNQENPIVYGTDHEVYFQEITNEGTLEAFFNRFLTKVEFLRGVEYYIEEIKTDK